MSPRLAASLAAAGLVLLLGGTAAYVFFRPAGDDRFAGCRSTQVAGGAGEIGGPFTLVDSKGIEVTDKDVITKPALVYFGYTFCPDVCPLDNARNAEALDLLEKQGIDAEGVFISIDPARDTPEQVGQFAESFGPRMIGLTGSPEQVRAASQAYKTYFRKHDDAGDDPYYLVDHSTFTYLVLPGHGFVEFFRRQDSAEDIARRTSCFTAKS